MNGKVAKQFHELKEQLKVQSVALGAELESEQTKLRAAQNGLLPYVQALEALNAWVNRQESPFREQMQAGLKAHGLLDIKVGTVPPHDPNWFERYYADQKALG